MQETIKKRTKIVALPSAGCSVCSHRKPSCPENIVMKSKWMEHRKYRLTTFLFNSHLGLDPGLANSHFYLSNDEFRGESLVEISCYRCYWSSSDLSSAKENIRKLHDCQVKVGEEWCHGYGYYQDYFNYTYEIDRLNSLLPKKNKFSPAVKNPGFCFDLARTGFYYKGPHDLVACNFCGLEANNWEEHDSAAPEHERLATINGQCVCPLVTGRYFHTNVKIGDDLLPVQCDSVRIDTGVIPNYNKYKEEMDRLKTFSQWPFENSINPAELARNYLISAGDNRLICCKCDLAFKVSGPEAKPLDFHKQQSPDCGMGRH